MNKIYYHNKDLDGVGSCIVIADWLNSNGEDFEVCGWDYGNPPPEIEEGVQYYIVDISFPAEVMKRLPSNTVWIDHHRTAINDSVEYRYDHLRGIREEGLAAIELCWKWCYPTDDAPFYGVTLLGKYDTWRKEEDWEEVLEYQFGMRSLDLYSDVKELNNMTKRSKVSSLESMMMDLEVTFDVKSLGKAILNYQRQQDTVTCKRAFLFDWEGLRFAAVNSFGNSEVLKEYKEPHDAVMMFTFNGNKWRFSLYSSPNFELKYDLSVIAKKFGGGGHPGACGFEVECINDVLADHIRYFK